MTTTNPPHGPGAEDVRAAEVRAAEVRAAEVRAADLTAEEIADRSDAELTAIGAELDGVRIIHREVRFEPGSAGDRRAERIVAAFFLLTAIAAIAFIVVFVAWPWKFTLTGGNSYLYTPLLGLTMGVALLALGGGIVAWGKLLIPHEEAVQERHDGYSDQVDRLTTAANLKDGLELTGVARRSLLKRSLGLAGGAIGLMAIVPLGGLMKKPNADAKNDLFTTQWKEGVKLVTVNGLPVRPEDLRPGGLETVFPGVEGGIKAADGSVMLIRMYPDVVRTPRKGQEDYTWPRDANGRSVLTGAYIAFSKICTHLGCPTSLYEQETDHILCPCHQSQFDVPNDAKPTFGPATRSLPVLPLDVDEDGYFIAKGPFREPIGPSFWERPDYD
jgi:ubiquinol-cytochrome c reductase iron-sulfur subunit